MKHTKYKVEEFANLHPKAVTPCPFGVKGKTYTIICVGGLGCQRCKYFHHIDKANQTVYCNFKK